LSVPILDLGVPYHLGIAVRDLEAAVGRYESLLGIGPWATRVSETDAVFRGHPTAHVSRWGMAKWGEAYLEVVEPLSGDSPAAELLREHGEGAYHVGYFAEDVSELRAPEEPPVLFSVGSPGEIRAVYLDTFESLGLYVELVRSSREGEFRKWVDGASRPPVDR
jgi:methylmalonyl-CoA/ethylmalonyl-CoA epimerase